ncbi:MAG: SDR family oxidoreductase [Methylobacteriaceae bacterium]|jgi:3-hydroxy acid dehydrogenase/malonic semialdehyde reductase|nr:SDR family oxidoreductase [Methylobacteriaceae bacterium]
MIVLVTGASVGFGAATSRMFVAKGYRVIGAARRAEKLNALAAELGENFLPLKLDVSDRPVVKAALEALPKEWSDIDVLVNNAGLALGLEPAHRASFEDWLTMIETNVTGLAHLTHLLLPGMVERGRGHIVNVGSIAGTYPYPGGNVYGATKAFVKQFSLNLRADLAGTPLRVTNIEPGMVGDTEFSLVRFKGDTARVEKNYEHVRYLVPDDIARSILFAVEQPPYVNINRIEIMPIAQTFSPMTIRRDA